MQAFTFSVRAFPSQLAAVFTALVFVAVPHFAMADDTAAVSIFVQGLGDKAIGTLANKKISDEEAGKVFRNMLHDSFDLNLLGKFALGPSNWKKATPEQKKEYLKLFERLVVQIYSDRFKLYSGEGFKVVSAKMQDDRDAYVVSEILRPDAGAPSTQVDWQVRKKANGFQVIDVIVEGVSMSVTQRSEFSSAIQKNGGDIHEFLDILRQRIAVIDNKK